MDEQKRQRLIAQARSAGWSDDEISKALYEGTVRQQQTAPQTTQVTKTPEKKAFDPTDLIPLAGGVAGGVLGSFIAPGVGTAVGGAGGAALGETLRQKIKGENTDLGKIALEGGLSAIPVTKLGGLALRGVGKVAGAAGENIVLRNLRPSKTQIAKFAKKTGENLDNFIVRNKLWEKGTQQVDDLITPMQQQYDELAKSTGTRIPVKDIVGGFKDKIEQLDKIPNTQVKALAGQLKDEMNLVQKNLKGKKDIGIDELTTLRRQIDQLVPESKFAADPLVQGKNKHVRDIYKNIIDTATGGETHAIGKELSKLYAYKELAELQGNLGRGNLLIGMQPLIQTVIGGTVGGGGTLAFGGNPADAFKNTLIGMGFVHLANNPKVLALASKSLQQAAKLGKIGKTPGETILPKKIIKQGSASLLDQSLTRGAAGAIGITPGATPEESIVPQAGAATTEIPGETPLQTQMPGQESALPEQPGGLTKERLIMAADWDIQNNGGRGLDEIKKLYDLHFGGAAAKPKSETQQARDDVSRLAQSAMQDLQSNNIKIGTAGIGARIEEFKSKFDAGDPATVEFNNKISSMKALIAKARGGTSFTANEEKLLNSYTPNVGDSRQQLEKKLKGLVELFASKGENVVADNMLPATPAQVSFPQ